MTDLGALSASDLARAYRTRQISPVEAVRDALARIDRFNPAVNAFLVIDHDRALEAARAAGGAVAACASRHELGHFPVWRGTGSMLPRRPAGCANSGRPFWRFGPYVACRRWNDLRPCGRGEQRARKGDRGETDAILHKLTSAAHRH